ncbi:hypothetical protein BTM25_01240 [Actinomadura rubteroloni]|uniref:Uncharacterized protein n=1 Tax=Actinomadura rubteroloni TaxID=1926885 RepID=A0A2P4UL21_9ACTN|nr:hypothetical protein [Actinomadura rubteroloni]POM25741.1 hypothetical protein BTM25_01240 [Actinomadura rubteroloni]
MESVDICDEIAAILVPYPTRGQMGGDAYGQAAAVAHEERLVVADGLRRALVDNDQDPLHTALSQAVARIRAAESDRLLLLAYARRFTRPRPYPLRDLKETAELSASSIRTAYNDDDVATVAERVGRRPVADGTTQ